MAKTITSGESSRGFTFSLVMNETIDVETNTSSISWTLQLSLKSGSGWSFYDFGVGWSAYINGVRVAYHDRASSDRYTLTAGNTWTMASGTTTVTHDTDGTKTISCSASMDMASSPSGAGPLSCSGDWVLTTIPRASTLTIPTLTIESASTLTVTAASNTFTHVISYAFFDLSGTIASLNAGVTTTSWTPPNTFYAKIPNATSGTVSITLETYSGATLIGSNTYTATVKVSSSIKPTVPTVTLSPVNTNAWISSQGLYVGGYSSVRVQSSASPGSGASIASYTVSGAFSATGADVTSGILTSGSKSITVTATDTRGRTNTKTSTVTFLAYSPPALTTFTAERGTYSGGSWSSDVNGNHIRITASATVSLSSQGNTGTIVATVGGNAPDATSGSYYYWTSTNNTTTYVASGTVTDSVGNSSTRTLSISTVEVPFNINVDLPGAAFGMIAQKIRTLELADTWKLDVGTVTDVESDLKTNVIFHGTCPTAAATTDKVATVTGTFPSALYDGMTVMIVFDYANSGAVADLTLNVNSTGAKPIKYVNNAVLTNLTAAGQIRAGVPVIFVYSVTHGCWVATGLNYNNTYSSMSEAEAVAGTATTARSITAARLDKAIKSKFADYVIEQGTSGNWTYRKWNSGVAECWGTFVADVTSWSAWGNLYEAQVSANVAPTYPTGLFIATPNITANAWASSLGVCGVELYSTHSASQAPRMIPLRPSDGGTGSVNISAYATGKWE